MSRKIISRFFMALMLVSLAACVSEDPVVDPVEAARSMTLRLKLVMGLEEDEMSRADKGDSDGYEPASGDFEKISTLRVIILHGSDRKVEGARMVATKADGTPINDNLEFKVTSNEFKTIVLIANEASLPSPVSGMTTSAYLDQFTTIGEEITDKQWLTLTGWTAAMTEANADNASVTTSLFSNLGGIPRLPLTEIFNLNTAALSEEKPISGIMHEDGEVKYEVTLFMTHAAAKATFHINGESDKWSGQKVTGIRLSGINGSEYVFPNTTTYNPAKYKEGDNLWVIDQRPDGKRFITSFNTPDKTTKGVTFEMSTDAVITKDEDVKCGPIYFPESKMAAAGEQYKVSVQIDGGDWLDAQPLETNILNIGGCDAIARNTYLKIYITFGEHNITWEAIEAPYNSVTLDPVFGL